jgi:hypothetical protein
MAMIELNPHICAGSHMAARPSKASVAGRQQSRQRAANSKPGAFPSPTGRGIKAPVADLVSSDAREPSVHC